jgi:catechol 2,3-dioxygenase-like lactoylglutathione lyase family enzyme
MIIGVHHVAISTRDIDALADWYAQAFGLEVVSRGGWQAGNPEIDGIVGLPDSAARTAMLRGRNLYVEMFQYESPLGRPSGPDRPVSDHGFTHFGVIVDDIDAEHERLLGLGMRFHAPPTGKGRMGGRLRACYGRDPEGNVVELIEITGDWDAAIEPIGLAR